MVEKKANVSASGAEPKRVQLTPEMARNLFEAERRRYSAIMKQRRKAERLILKTDKTIFSLEEITSSKADDMFVNLGSGVYLSAKVLDTKNVKFMVGSEVFLNKSVEDVLKELKARKEAFAKDLKNLQGLELQSQESLNKLYSFLVQSSKAQKQ